MARLSYRIVDVFSDRPFSGNPLAVVLGAEDLATEEIRALAREFNLSETAFPMAADQPGADDRVVFSCRERSCRWPDILR
jgi:trans-2,3-dihydro-3-hydroxyanthranilate isomerase